MAVDGTECGPPHRPPGPTSAAAAGRAFRRASAGWAGVRRTGAPRRRPRAVARPTRRELARQALRPGVGRGPAPARPLRRRVARQPEHLLRRPAHDPGRQAASLEAGDPPLRRTPPDTRLVG